MHTSILSVFPSDLPGVNPATLNGILLYYRLMTKRSGLGDSTELSRVELSHECGRKSIWSYVSDIVDRDTGGTFESISMCCLSDKKI
jgi:hypothetical protein